MKITWNREQNPAPLTRHHCKVVNIKEEYQIKHHTHKHKVNQLTVGQVYLNKNDLQTKFQNQNNRGGSLTLHLYYSAICFKNYWSKQLNYTNALSDLAFQEFHFIDEVTTKNNWKQKH